MSVPIMPMADYVVVVAEEAENKTALKLFPENLNIQTQFAIAATNKPAADVQEIVIGIAVLECCNNRMSVKANRGLTTYWSKDFISFWSSRAKDNLKKKLSE